MIIRKLLSAFFRKREYYFACKTGFRRENIIWRKKYEYRKRLCKKEINKIYIYATSPVKMMIGEVGVISKMSMDREKLWQETQKYAGITKKFYDQYFEYQDCACAYRIGEVRP